ncbi:MAG: T9SS type A sorting domain-containing protein [Bacteroidota bacterium]
MKKLLLLLTLTLAVYTQLFAATLTAVSGNWSDPATWGGVLPQSGDIVIIPEGITVDVDAMFGTFDNFRLEVYGTLNFIGGKKITLTANGQVYISPTGTITGGNGGSQFEIGGTDIYVGGNGGQATGTLIGPLDCGSGGCGTSTVPIKLISFTASKTTDGVLLTWVTETETNNEFYSIERSADGINFEVVGKVKGAGNSIYSTEYTYLDKPLQFGTIYYRLKQTDYNGDFEYFDMITVYNEMDTNKPVLFPNPSNGSNIKFYYHNTSLANLRLEVTSIAGTVIYEQKFENNQEYISQEIDLTSIKKGSYFVNVYQGDEVVNHKLVVN